MKTRDKKLTDYGVPKAEQKKLYEKCQNLTTEERNLLIRAALETCPIGLVSPMLSSLMEKKSYNALSKIMYVSINDHDFYAYRRKTIARFYHMMKEEKDHDER